jgi:hypothetical protein
LKKILLFALLFVPAGAFAALPPSWTSGTVDCTIAAGVLSCTAPTGNPNGDLINTDNITVGFAPDGLEKVLLVGPGGRSGIRNTGMLELVPSAGGTIPGDVVIGGYVWNGVKFTTADDTNNNFLFDAGETISSDYYPALNQVSNSLLKIDAGRIDINGSDANGVSILNLSNWRYYDYNGSGISIASVYLKSAGSLSVAGSVWNNTVDGATAFNTGASTAGVILSAVGGITIDGDFATFGGQSVIDSGYTLEIDGKIVVGANSLLSLNIGNNILKTGGIDTMGRLDVGYAMDGTMNGRLELAENADTLKTNYVIRSTGGINIGGGLASGLNALNLAAGKSLEIDGVNSTLNYIDVDFNGIGTAFRGISFATPPPASVVFGAFADMLTARGEGALVSQLSTELTASGGVMSPAIAALLTANGYGDIADILTANVGVITPELLEKLQASLDSLGFGNISAGAGAKLYVGAAGQSGGMVASFNSGNIEAAAGAEIVIKTANGASAGATTSTNDITVGNIENEGKILNLGADDDLTVGYMNNNTASADKTNLSAGGDLVIGGYLYNRRDNELVLYAGGNISVGGDTNNSGGGTIAIARGGGDVLFAGNVTNMANGAMYFGWDWHDDNGNWMYNNTDPAKIIDVNEWSFISPLGSLTIDGVLSNNGSFRANVAGETSLGGVLNQINAADFYLETGTLVFTNVDSVDYMASLLNNTMPKLYLKLTGSGAGAGINASSIVNGASAQDMYLGAEVMNISGIVGNLSLGKMALESRTTISAGVIDNDGTMSVYAAGGGVLSYVDNDGTLVVKTAVGTQAGQTGAQLLTIGYLENDGSLEIDANKLAMTGDFVNRAGSAKIYFHNAALSAGEYHFQKIIADGGSVDVGGLAGTMLVNDGISVGSGGFLNISGELSAITIDYADGSAALSVAKDLTWGTGTGYAAGNMNIDVIGTNPSLAIDVGGGTISIGGNVRVDGNTAKTLELKSSNANGINIAGALSAVGAGAGSNTNTIVLNAGKTTANTLVQSGRGRIRTSGNIAVAGAASINGGINFNSGNSFNFGGYLVGNSGGLLIDDGAASASISAASLTFGGGVEVAAGKQLSLYANGIISGAGGVINYGNLSFSSVTGAVNLGGIGNAGVLAITSAGGGSLGGIVNCADASCVGNTITIANNSGSLLEIGDITNNAGGIAITNGGNYWMAGAIGMNGGTMTLTGSSLTVGSIAHTAGSIDWNGWTLKSQHDITLAGDLAFGGATNPYALKLEISGLAQTLDVGGNLDVAGALVAYSGDAKVTGHSGKTLAAETYAAKSGAYMVVSGADTFRISGSASSDATNTFVNDGRSDISADNIIVGKGIVNSGVLSFVGAATVAIADIDNGGTFGLELNDGSATLGKITNSGTMNLTVWNAALKENALVIGGIVGMTGSLNVAGNGFRSLDDISVNNIIQGGAGGSGSISILNGNIDFAISMAEGKTLHTDGGISGKLGHKLTLNTTSLEVGGNLSANSGRIVVSATDYLASCVPGPCSLPNGVDYAPSDDWSPFLSVDIGGSVSSGVEFLGLGRMHVGGDYLFNNRSKLMFSVLPNGNGGVGAGRYDVFAPIGLDASGQVVVNVANSKPIIDVDGTFYLDFHNTNSALQPPKGEFTGDQFKDGSIGLTIFDFDTVKNKDVAVWLVQADGGIVSFDILPRSLNVYFCNADMTRCFDYLGAAGFNPGGVPVYMRQDGDSLFAVFDPNYGGPIGMYSVRKMIQPMNPDFNVDHAAGAIDNWIDWGLYNAKFYNSNPIEALKAAYSGTIYSNMADELYNRMEYSHISNVPQPLHEFSRLFTPTEAGQFAHLVNSAERMAQNSLQKRMVDESLWTRNRVKSKLWVDANYGIDSLSNPDGDGAIEGKSMSASAGYDVQLSQGLIIGFNAGMTIASNNEKQSLDLSYGAVSVMGGRDTTAKSTSVNVGGYIISKFSDAAQLYISGNFYSHKLGVDRTQNYVADIGGDGQSSGFGGEIGIIHLISGQYVVGNLSARFVRNDGFEFKETSGGQDYMSLKQDAYTTLAPGYSLMLQKRIYLQPTFIMRPYLSVGAEYEIIGMGEKIRYKFASSGAYSDYKIDASPLWVTGKAGLEFLTISGLQFGVGYGYHHNSAIRTHNLHLGASMRF